MATTKTGSNVSLTQMASILSATAAQSRSGQAHVRLPRGLHIVFGRIEGVYRLAMGREAPSSPSDDEITLVASAFAAPAGAGRSEGQSKWRHPTSGRTITFNVVEFTWRNAATAPNPESEPVG